MKKLLRLIGFNTERSIYRQYIEACVTGPMHDVPPRPPIPMPRGNQARLTSQRLSPWIKFVDWRIAGLEQEARYSLGARLKLDALKTAGAL